MRMLAHRIADRRVLRLIRMWLEAGVLESGEWRETDRGTPQGAGISPLLANVFLHYVLDLWVQQWRRRHTHGRLVIVRYADDFVMGFEKADDAHRMLAALKERLTKFGLVLHDEKTRSSSLADCRLWLGDNVVCGVQRPSPFSASLTTAGGHGMAGLL